jgi:hypothetical protein
MGSAQGAPGSCFHIDSISPPCYSDSVVLGARDIQIPESSPLTRIRLSSLYSKPDSPRSNPMSSLREQGLAAGRPLHWCVTVVEESDTEDWRDMDHIR